MNEYVYTYPKEQLKKELDTLLSGAPVWMFPKLYEDLKMYEMEKEIIMKKQKGDIDEGEPQEQKESDDNYIKMDGEYHEFEGGAIRYTKTGKGRFDLIPWETVKLVTDKIVNDDLYEAYTTEMDVLVALSQRDAIEVIIDITAVKYGEGMFSADAFAWMLRDLAVHYEKGAEKYGVDNWKKGIPASSFWDSGCRHTCQFINGLEDEPHWISAIWNMLGYLWTINKKD